jgi:hypothetical protein
MTVVDRILLEGMRETNAHLLEMFPSIVHNDARVAIGALPNNPRQTVSFRVRVAGENVSIPTRIHHDPAAISLRFRLGLSSPIQKELLDCVFTRHANGHIRQERLVRILRSKNFWIPPFVIQLAGEYVVEILEVIAQALPSLDCDSYQEFARNNPQFIFKTNQRIISYWDCFYRSFKRQEYPGFKISSFLQDLSLPRSYRHQ